MVKAAGKTAVFVVGGEKAENEELVLKTTEEIINCGAVGWAVGRNIWQAKEPVELAKKIAEILYK